MRLKKKAAAKIRPIPQWLERDWVTWCLADFDPEAVRFMQEEMTYVETIKHLLMSKLNELRTIEQENS